MPPASITFVAQIDGVREVSLFGAADLAYWRDRLAAEGLAPLEESGRAKVLLVAAEMKYMGIRFRELSISVLVQPDHSDVCRERCASGNGDAAWLLQAYNSSRLFAFCERWLFSTPYRYGDVRVSTSIPVSIRLTWGGEVLLAATMSSAKPRDESPVDSAWEGPVYLPRVSRSSMPSGKYFIARLQGRARLSPFGNGDQFDIHDHAEHPVLASLIESHFTAQTWSLREAARHAKSKTYHRGNVLSE